VIKGESDEMMTMRIPLTLREPISVSFEEAGEEGESKTFNSIQCIMTIITRVIVIIKKMTRKNDTEPEPNLHHHSFI